MPTERKWWCDSMAYENPFLLVQDLEGRIRTRVPTIVEELFSFLQHDTMGHFTQQG